MNSFSLTVTLNILKLTVNNKIRCSVQNDILIDWKMSISVKIQTRLVTDIYKINKYLTFLITVKSFIKNS